MRSIRWAGLAAALAGAGMAVQPAGAQAPDPEALLRDAAEAVRIQQSGDHAAAAVLLEDVEARLTPLAGPDHPVVAGIRARLAESLAEIGDDRALPMAEAAVTVFEDAGLGASVQIAQPLDARARARSRRLRFAEAETDYRRALAIVETTGGGSTDHLSTALNNLAFVLDAQGKHAEAARYYLRGVAAAEAAPAPAPAPALARMRINLAAALSASEEHQAAAAEMAQALGVLIAELGPDHPDTLAALRMEGQLLSARGEIEAAVGRLGAVRAAAEARFGPDSPETAKALQTLGHALAQSGRLDEAEASLRRALVIDAGRHPAIHPLRLAREAQLAAVIQARGRDAEALDALRGVAATLTRRGLDDPARRAQEWRLYRPLFNMTVSGAWRLAHPGASS